jgi:hypothetical protein
MRGRGAAAELVDRRIGKGLGAIGEGRQPCAGRRLGKGGRSPPPGLAWAHAVICGIRVAELTESGGVSGWESAEGERIQCPVDEKGATRSVTVERRGFIGFLRWSGSGRRVVRRWSGSHPRLDRAASCRGGISGTVPDDPAVQLRGRAGDPTGEPVVGSAPR